MCRIGEHDHPERRILVYLGIEDISHGIIRDVQVEQVQYLVSHEWRTDKFYLAREVIALYGRDRCKTDIGSFLLYLKLDQGSGPVNGFGIFQVIVAAYYGNKDRNRHPEPVLFQDQD